MRDTMNGQSVLVFGFHRIGFEGIAPVLDDLSLKETTMDI